MTSKNREVAEGLAGPHAIGCQLTLNGRGACNCHCDERVIAIEAALDKKDREIKRLKYKIESLQGDCTSWGKNYNYIFSKLEAAEKEVERLKVQMEGSVGWRTALEQRTRATNSEAHEKRLREALERITMMPDIWKAQNIAYEALNKEALAQAAKEMGS